MNDYNLPEINMIIESATIEAKTRKLKGDWHFEHTNNFIDKIKGFFIAIEKLNNKPKENQIFDDL